MLVENPLNSSALSFPILECFHIVGFAISIGTIALADFRLLGWGMQRETPAQLAKDTFFGTLNYTICRRTAMSGATTGAAKPVACVSLGLWICVIFGGIFIGFLNPTVDLNQI